MKKSRGMMKSMVRMFFTFGGSYFGAKAMGWVFDNVVDRQGQDKTMRLSFKEVAKLTVQFVTATYTTMYVTDLVGKLFDKLVDRKQ